MENMDKFKVKNSAMKVGGIFNAIVYGLCLLSSIVIAGLAALLLVFTATVFKDVAEGNVILSFIFGLFNLVGGVYGGVMVALALSVFAASLIVFIMSIKVVSKAGKYIEVNKSKFFFGFYFVVQAAVIGGLVYFAVTSAAKTSQDSLNIAIAGIVILSFNLLLIYGNLLANTSKYKQYKKAIKDGEIIGLVNGKMVKGEKKTGNQAPEQFANQQAVPPVYPQGNYPPQQGYNPQYQNPNYNPYYQQPNQGYYPQGNYPPQQPYNNQNGFNSQQPYNNPNAYGNQNPTNAQPQNVNAEQPKTSAESSNVEQNPKKPDDNTDNK